MSDIDLIPAGDVTSAASMTETDAVLVSANGVTRRVTPNVLAAWLSGAEDTSLGFKISETGDGVTTSYALPSSSSAQSGVSVWVGGLYQMPDTAFTVSGATLTFSEPPPDGEPIMIAGGVPFDLSSIDAAAVIASGGPYNGKSVVESQQAQGGSLPTRADLVAAKDQFTMGAVVSAGGVSYRYDGVSATIPDLPGWTPHGPAMADHFAANTNPGTTDMTAAAQACLDAMNAVRFLATDYLIAGTLLLKNGAVVQGTGPAVAAYVAGYAGNGTRLIGTGTSGAMFSDGTTGDPLNHIAIRDCFIYVTGGYAQVMNFGRMSGFDFAGTRIEITGLATAGIVTTKPALTDTSWVLQWQGLRIRLPDASTARPFDIDMGDGAIIGGSFTGGIGARISGTGGLKLVGGRYDRSTGYALTIDIKAEPRAQHVISGCQIEEFDTGGILINGDANDARTETWVQPNITGNMFRGRGGAAADITFANASGAILRGGLVSGNTHTNGTPPISIDRARWKDVSFFAGQQYGVLGTTQLVGGAYRQSPLVIAQGAEYVQVTGTTEETTLTSATIPGGTLRAKGSIRVKALVTCNNDTNAKTVRIKFGGTSFVDVALANLTGGQIDATIYNLTETTQRGPARNIPGPGTTTIVPAYISGTVDTTVDQTVSITAQLADAADNLTLQNFEIIVTPWEALS